MPDPTAPIAISVSYAGHTTAFTLPPSARLSDLHSLLHNSFRVPPSSQKLIHKGHQLTEPSSLLSDLLLHPNVKLLLVGPSEEGLESLRAIEDERRRKKAAFEFHRAHPAPKVRNTSVATIGQGDEQYSFQRIVPFPPTVPCEGARKAMLDKLAKDPAVHHVMAKHKYVVGVLTELHPVLQPTLLGLNKNAGEEISLRLLTDAMDGTRSYREVRRVLLHELCHNTFGPHDNDFNELNSLLNKEVAAFELESGITTAPGAEEETPWSPAGYDDVVRTAHTLSEVSVTRRTPLRSGAEEDLEEKREKARVAAERRRREDRDGGSREEGNRLI